MVQLFEQPELHLHPQQQAATGDILIRATRSGKQIIAETHSIHLILRVLRRIGENFKKNIDIEKKHTEFTNDDLKILYADSLWNGHVDFQEIAVSESGKFLQPWPDGFFEQEFKERFAIN